MVKKSRLRFCIVFLFMLMLFSLSSCTLEMDKRPGTVEIIAPETVSRSEPFEVQIKAEGVGANYLQTTSPCIFVEGEVREGDEDSLPRSGTRFYTRYDGEEDFTVKMATFPFRSNSSRECKIEFRNVKSSFSFSSTINRVDWEFDVEDVNILHDISSEYMSQSSNPQELSFSMRGSDITGNIRHHQYPYVVSSETWDYQNPMYEELFLEEANDELRFIFDGSYESTTSDGRKTFYTYDVRGDSSGSTTTTVKIKALRFYPHFYVDFYLEKIEEVEKGQGGAAASRIKNELLNKVKSVQIQEGGRTSGVVKDGDYKCGDCPDDYVCGACENCIKEEDAIDPGDVDLELDLFVAQPQEEILNSVTEYALFRIYPNAVLSVDNEEIDYCDIKDPGLNLSIQGKIDEEEANVYSGFTLLGRVTDERKPEEENRIDLEENNPYATYVLSPNKRTKFFEDTKDIQQNLEFKVMLDGNEIEREEAMVNLIPPEEFTLELSARQDTVQQGSTRALEIKVDGGTTPRITNQIRLIGPGNMGTTGREINRDWILKTISQGETLTISYQAPPMGNFDIGEALSTLSMVDLQREAAEQIVSDAFGAYRGKGLDALEAASDAGEISKRWGQMKRAYGKYSDAQTVIGLPGDLADIGEEAAGGLGAEEQAVEAGWVERGANLGVSAISATQTAVSVLTFVPDRIPALGRMSAATETAFSAATNIWKANFEYIAESEKIERAQELYYPAPIIVTSKDISGWTIQEIYVFRITYHQVN